MNLLKFINKIKLINTYFNLIASRLLIIELVRQYLLAGKPTNCHLSGLPTNCQLVLDQKIRNKVDGGLYAKSIDYTEGIKSILNKFIRFFKVNKIYLYN